jgi:hypothetical protein
MTIWLCRPTTPGRERCQPLEAANRDDHHLGGQVDPTNDEETGGYPWPARQYATDRINAYGAENQHGEQDRQA